MLTALIDLGGVAADSTATNVAGNVGSEGYVSAVETSVESLLLERLEEDHGSQTLLLLADIDAIISVNWTKKALLLSTLCTSTDRLSLDVDDMLGAAGAGASSSGGLDFSVRCV